MVDGPGNTIHATILAALVLSPVVTWAQAVAVTSRALAIHESAIIVDMHEDTPQRFLDERYDIGSTDPKDHDYISLDKAKSGNLGAQFFSIWVNPDGNQGHYAKRTLERAHTEHKLAALLGIEGGHSLQDDIRLLRDFYRLGAR